MMPNLMSKQFIYTIGALALVAGAILSYQFVPSVREAVGMNIITMPPAPETDFVPPSGELPKDTSKEQSTAVQTGEICAGEADVFTCYEKHYQALVKAKGIPAAFADLKARYAKDTYTRAQCHPLTHVIGREAALKFKTPSAAYAVGDGYCWSGYYHGVLETFIDRIGIKNLPTEMDHVCDGVAGKERYSFDYYNCVHGLGHGVMAITETELFESLDYCDTLTGRWEQESCASGAYMENVIVDNINHFTKYLDPKRPLYPCTESPEKYKNTCYLMQTSYILKVNGGDFADTFGWCRTAEEPYRATCLQSLGRDASGRSTSEVQPTKRICMLGRDHFEKSNCVIGAVKDFISYFHSDKQAKQLCNAFEDKELTTLCLQTTTSYYAQF